MLGRGSGWNVSICQCGVVSKSAMPLKKSSSHTQWQQTLFPWRETVLNSIFQPGVVLIYIYKTVVCDRVLTLYRPCAYPGAVLRHASSPTGPRNSSRSFSPFIKSSLPGSSKSLCSKKQTKPSLSKINNSTLKMKLFLSKGFLAHFHGFVVWSVHVSKSCHPRIDRTLSVRRIVMSICRASVPTSPRNLESFSVHQNWNRRSRDRLNHVVPESKPNPASPQLYFENEAFF